LFHDQAVVVHSVGHVIEPVAADEVILDPGTDRFGHPPRCSFEESEALMIVDESAILDDALRVVENRGTRPRFGPEDLDPEEHLPIEELHRNLIDQGRPGFDY
jgi:hypothetical protein